MNKKRIHTVLAGLPVLLFLACGAAKETVNLPALQDGQEFFETKQEEAADASEKEEEQATACVHICGEVWYPGVYEVEAGARICDVLLLAGGFTQEAAAGQVNLAQKVTDGMQVVIPSVTEQKEAEKKEELKTAGMVDINTASLTELCSLPGIGQSRAEAIIAYREETGGFRTAEEIMQISGIKEGMYERLKDKIYVK